MTDEARIARLTELSRRVWPGHAHTLVVGVEDGIDVSAEDPIAFVDTPHERLLYIEHESSLDALEAALLVLAGETPLVAAGQGAMSRLASKPVPTYPGRTPEEEAELRAHPEYEPGAPTYVEWLREQAAAAEAKIAHLEKLAKTWDARAADAERFVQENPTMGNLVAKLIAGSVLTVGDAYAHCARELRRFVLYTDDVLRASEKGGAVRVTAGAMTDEARIARLTEIAQRVWWEPNITPNPGLNGELRGYSVKAAPQAYSDGITVWHPRALDALEAALLVLAGERHVAPVLPIDPEAERTVEQLIGNALQGKVHRDVGRSRSYRLTSEPPAWVEKLASKWDERAAEHEAASQRARDANKDHHGAYQAGVATGRIACARELRACVKGEQQP